MKVKEKEIQEIPDIDKEKNNKINKDNKNEDDKNKNILKPEKKPFDINEILKMDLGDLKKKLLNNMKKIKSFKAKEKKRDVVGFDIGSSSIKIAQGIYYKNNLTISKYVKIDTPEDAIIDGEIKKEEELASKIKEALSKNKINSKYGTCTSNSTLIINRAILIPKVEDDEIETVVRYEIQQYLPINLNDYVIQVKVLNKVEELGVQKLEVRVTAYPEKIARGYYNLLKKLDLKPYALDVNYNALNKLINYVEIENEKEHKSQGSTVFINLGANSIEVNIYKDGNLDFTRIIKAGGNNINEVIKETMGLNSLEAEEYKKKNLDLYNEENKFNIEVIDEWIEKIEKIIQFYKNKNLGNEVEKIFIFGGSSKINGFDKYITEKIGIKTKRVQGISKMTFKSEDDGKPIDDFINVIGSIIRL